MDVKGTKKVVSKLRRTGRKTENSQKPEVVNIPDNSKQNSAAAGSGVSQQDSGAETRGHSQNISDQEGMEPSESSDLDASAITDDLEFEDAQEALGEANQTLGMDDNGASSHSRTFQGIDNQNISLSDIQRQESERGLRNPTQRGDLNRSSTIHDLPRASSRYGLRPAPKPVKRFGSPVKIYRKLTRKK